jgi:hypothetical protein
MALRELSGGAMPTRSDYVAAVGASAAATFVTAPVMTVLDLSLVRMQLRHTGFAAGEAACVTLMHRDHVCW